MTTTNLAGSFLKSSAVCGGFFPSSSLLSTSLFSTVGLEGDVVAGIGASFPVGFLFGVGLFFGLSFG
ncbi:hypothetical protein, partial [uncultured Corynebacterium sp.]|uniref:hypothetical protein n=1 Tax=uncultured Corynebacterium sp. TaxID=159447 RepID=UPI0025DF9B87